MIVATWHRHDKYKQKMNQPEQLGWTREAEELTDSFRGCVKEPLRLLLGKPPAAVSVPIVDY